MNELDQVNLAGSQLLVLFDEGQNFLLGNLAYRQELLLKKCR
jgi:hypothetical protein